MNDLFIDCQAEYKRLVQLQRDCEWEGKDKDAEQYRLQALHYRELISKGILYEPKFMENNQSFNYYKKGEVK